MVNLFGVGSRWWELEVGELGPRGVAVSSPRDLTVTCCDLHTGQTFDTSKADDDERQNSATGTRRLE